MSSNMPQQIIPSFPMASLYVGDLDSDVTEAMLYDKFAAIGEVLSLRLCRDMRTKQSLGYGYVNFSSPSDAEKAMDTMNFDLLNGKPVRIMWCQRDPSLRKSGIGNVFIKNLDKRIDNKSMYDTFSAFGNILSCKIAFDENGESKGFGFVHFENEEIALRAIEKVNGMLINEKKVYVGKFIPRSEREKSVGHQPNSFTNIFVKNFGSHMPDDDFFTMFSKFGKITSYFVARHEDGDSKGFGFIAYADSKDAETAVSEMNGYEYAGRILYVGRAQKKAERLNDLRKQFEHQKLERLNKWQGSNVYIKNLDETFDNDNKLKQVFQQFGSISSAKIMTNNGRSRGFGFVCFTTPEEANRAIQEMNGKLVGTKPLYVGLAQHKAARRAYLASQYIARAQFRKQTGIQYTTNSPFILSAITQGPRIFNPAAPLKTIPRWQMMPRPNGANFGLPLLGVPTSLSVSSASIRNTNQSILTSANVNRTITGALVPNSRPNSKYTTSYISDMARNQELKITHAPPQEQKKLLGEKLFRIVETFEPELAGKITGMLLEIDNGELLQMIKDQDSLRAKVDEAIAVLEAHKGSAAATVAVED